METLAIVGIDTRVPRFPTLKARRLTGVACTVGVPGVVGVAGAGGVVAAGAAVGVGAAALETARVLGRRFNMI